MCCASLYIRKLARYQLQPLIGILACTFFQWVSVVVLACEAFWALYSEPHLLVTSLGRPEHMFVLVRRDLPACSHFASTAPGRITLQRARCLGM